MLSKEDNELLTRVGAGTPMGNTMRRYWIPALLSREIGEPDSPPVRVRLLGEDLIAFRDSRGRVGLLNELCPHRRASLYFGRNEECGIRCVYHGWKFDFTGACVDMMNEPEDYDFKHKVRTTAYPTRELGGIVWAYLGPTEWVPPIPSFAWARAPESHVHATKVIEECNWLQGLEGGIDTSHAPIMHRLLREDAKAGGFRPSDPFVRGRPPRLEVDVTDYGFRYAGVRALDEGEIHVRTYQSILPFHQIRPGKETGVETNAGHAWVPIDDENTMVYNWTYCPSRPLSEDTKLERALGNGPLHVDVVTFRSKANRANNYLLDREMQRRDNFTGIDGINVQDRAIQESMGRIVDRSKEHLGPADKAIIQARKLLLKAVKAVQAGGVPDGVAVRYDKLAAHEAVLPRDGEWRGIAAHADVGA